MLFVDHGIFRVVYNNRYELAGGLFRCSQPSPGQLRKYHERYGIKTVVNLRGADQTRRYALEEHACRQLGMTLVNHKGILSRSAPEVAAILATRDLFESMAYPAIVHCKSGADRAGFFAVLYRVIHLKEPVETALAELGWKFGHLKASKTGILDFFFETYLAYNAHTPIDFMSWVQTVYNRDELKAAFKPQGWANFIVDTVLHRE